MNEVLNPILEEIADNLVALPQGLHVSLFDNEIHCYVKNYFFVGDVVNLDGGEQFDDEHKHIYLLAVLDPCGDEPSIFASCYFSNCTQEEAESLKYSEKVIGHLSKHKFESEAKMYTFIEDMEKFQKSNQ